MAARAAETRAAAGVGTLAGLFAAAALLGGCVAGPPSAAAPSSAAVGPAVLADRLPAVAAGFRRGAARPTGGDSGEGREVSYATGGVRSTAAATVELLGENTGAAAALDAMLADLPRAGPAREMREAGRLTLASGGTPPLLCAETAGRYGRERVAGLVCAGRAGGALLRIRVTMPARGPPPADPRAFAEAIAASLSGGAAVAAAPAG